MEEWKEYKLIDVCSRLKSGKSIKANLVFDKGEFPVIGGNGVRGYTNISNFQGECGVIGRQGAYCGNVRYFEGEFYMTEHAIVVVGNEYADTYYLTSLLSLMHLGNLSAQSAQPGISVQTLSKQNIVLPPIIYQKRVSKILKSLDDKIEVNRRINEQLEELAGALFKSWFVDFEPFKDGEFVDSELGMIPKGWKVGTLGEVCEKITDGSHYSPKDNPMCNIPMLSVKDMQKYSFDYNKSKHIDEEEYAKMKANDCVPLLNDILVAKDGSYLKEIFICKKEIKQAILSSIAIFRANKSIIYPIILLCILKSPKTLKNVSENYVSGSALPRIVLKDFKRYNIIIPPLESQRRFNDIVCAIYDKIYANVEEITHLTNLRDTLLPKLMSGEIDVNEVKI